VTPVTSAAYRRSHSVLSRTTSGRIVSHQRPTGEVTVCSRGLHQDAWYHIGGLQEKSQCALEDYVRTHGITSAAYRRSHSVLSRTTSGRMASHRRPTGEVTVCSRGLRQDAWYHIGGLQEKSQCALEDYVRTHGITSAAYRRSHSVLSMTTSGRMISHQRPTGEVTMCSRGLRQDAWYHISGLQEKSQCALDDYVRTHGITSAAYRRSHSVLSRTTSGRSIQDNRHASASCCCDCRHCAPCRLTSSSNCSSYDWSARRPSTRSYATCC